MYHQSYNYQLHQYIHQYLCISHYIMIEWELILDTNSYIPSQVVPFPVYPWLHVQVKLPGVLVHVALESQLLVVALAHISMALMDLAKTRMEKLNFNCVVANERTVPTLYKYLTLWHMQIASSSIISQCHIPTY